MMPTVVTTATLAYYLGESVVTPEMEMALERAEAIAASRIGCRELKYRTVEETVLVHDEHHTMLGGLSSLARLQMPVLHLSDGPARQVNALTLKVGDETRNLLEGARISETGWAIHYRFPVAFGFKIDLPYDEVLIDAEYDAGWEDEVDLPNGIRQFVIAQATQIYATPIGGVIKVRLGDNYVDLSPSAIAKQVDQYAEMMDQWVRVRL